ncbi:hypothetical protein IMZ48_45050 [Candidatus Bathyarchaeota archaeon]|nr:hypothetical protein [Candidatus Bathyarchaeota archaeon]
MTTRHIMMGPITHIPSILKSSTPLRLPREPISLHLPPPSSIIATTSMIDPRMAVNSQNINITITMIKLRMAVDSQRLTMSKR